MDNVKVILSPYSSEVKDPEKCVITELNLFACR